MTAEDRIAELERVVAVLRAEAGQMVDVVARIPELQAENRGLRLALREVATTASRALGGE